MSENGKCYYYLRWQGALPGIRGGERKGEVRASVSQAEDGRVGEAVEQREVEGYFLIRTPVGNGQTFGENAVC